MEVACRTPIPVGLVASTTRAGWYAFIVKATYKATGSNARLATVHEPLRDAYVEGDRVYFPSDFAESKVACDVAIIGPSLLTKGSVTLNVGPIECVATRAIDVGPFPATQPPAVSFAPPARRMPFPSLPLAIDATGPGWRVSTMLPLPKPTAALVIGQAWSAATPIDLSIDGVLVDPARLQVEVTSRGYFQHAGNVHEEVVVLCDPAGQVLGATVAERTRWQRVKASTPFQKKQEVFRPVAQTLAMTNRGGTYPQVPMTSAMAPRAKTPAITRPREAPGFDDEITNQLDLSALRSEFGSTIDDETTNVDARILDPETDTLDQPPPAEDKRDLGAFTRTRSTTVGFVGRVQPALPFNAKAAPAAADEDAPVSSRTSVTEVGIVEAKNPSGLPFKSETPPPADKPSFTETVAGAKSPAASAGISLPPWLKNRPPQDRPATPVTTRGTPFRSDTNNEAQNVGSPPAPPPAVVPAAVAMPPVAPQPPVGVAMPPVAPQPPVATPIRPVQSHVPSFMKQPSQGGDGAMKPGLTPDAASASGSASVPQVRHEGLSLDEYVAIRKELWAEGASRRAVLKRHNLSELRWRVIERVWTKQLETMAERPDAVRSILDALAARP